jgi:hypothetical protein
LLYVTLTVFVAGSALLIRPVRRTAATLVIAGANRAGRRAPDLFARWAAPPPGEATAAFRRLAVWPARLGFPPRGQATAHERAEAVASVLPEQRQAIQSIVEAYAAERYGGKPAVPGEPGRIWKALRPHLYRAALKRLVGSLFGPRNA